MKMTFLHKTYFSIIFAVYSLILLHNITPHTHGIHIFNDESSVLQKWFNLIFGPEHQEEIQDNSHLTTYKIHEENISENDKLDFNLDFDLVKVFWKEQNFLIIFNESFISFNFSWLNLNISVNSSKYTSAKKGRAPPVLI